MASVPLALGVPDTLTTVDTTYQGYTCPDGTRNVLIYVSGDAWMAFTDVDDTSVTTAEAQFVPSGTFFTLRAPGSKHGDLAVQKGQTNPADGNPYPSLNDISGFSLAAQTGTITVSVTALSENFSS